MMSPKAFAAFCCLSPALLGLNLFAQPATVPVTITVTDPTGAVIPGQFSGVTTVAEVKLIRPSDSAQPIMLAGRNGQLAVQVEPGKYELSASFPGFKTATRQVEVTSEPNQALTIVLPIGGCTECVAVQGAPVSQPVQKVKDLPSPKEMPEECQEAATKWDINDPERAGVPRFFSPHSKVSYGISFRGSETQYSDRSPAFMYIWIDNGSNSSLCLGTCSLFATWDVDVWSASHQRMLNHREQKDHQLWPEKFSCGANVIINIPAHGCSIVEGLELTSWYTLPRGLYTVSERPAEDWDRPPKDKKGLSFVIGN
jgi:hypothetical protein